MHDIPKLQIIHGFFSSTAYIRVDSLSEYIAYQTKYQDILEHRRSTRNSKPPQWPMERAAKFFGAVRAGIEFDYYPSSKFF